MLLLQALRIVVNDELNAIEVSMVENQSVEVLTNMWLLYRGSAEAS
jgi:16S rRNA C1402 N4-methylase RsmH